MPKTDVYELVTNRVIEQLETGVIPWARPWHYGPPANLVSRKPYRGINFILLSACEYSSRFWLTFNQAKKLGGYVRSGEQGFPVVFWKFIKKETEELDEDGEHVIKKFPLIRYYMVFNVEQTTLDAPCEDFETVMDAPAAAKRVVENCRPEPVILDSDQAFYSGIPDVIGMPPVSSFYNESGYYETLFHELVHWTGHKSRLNREGIVEPSPFGSDRYSFEELVAELGSAMLQAHVGIEGRLENSVGYIDHWLKVLKRDKTFIIKASSAAQKGCDFILDEDGDDE